MKYVIQILSFVAVFVSSLVSCLVAGAAETGETQTHIKDKWALVIGVSKFQAPGMDLRYAAHDAEAFSNYLIKSGEFRPDHVKLLTDGAATRNSILKLLAESWLPRVVDPDDLVVIYLGSHGTSSQSDVVGVNYIVTHDTVPGSLYSTAIATQDFLRLIRSRVPAKKILLVLDTCFSGSAQLDERKPFNLCTLDSDEFFNSTGQAVLSSSASDQPSLESIEYRSGLFTHHFINGLLAGGQQGTLAQAYEYTVGKVKDDSRRISRGALTQVPVFKANRDLEQLQLAKKAESPHDGVVAANSVPESLDAELSKHISWSTLMDKADADYHAGRLSLAESEYRQAVKLADLSFGDEDSRLATSLCSLGNILDATSRSDEAEQIEERALAIAKKAVGDKHPYVANISGNLASIELTKGHYAKAEQLCRSALEIAERKRPNSAEHARLLARLGAICLYENKKDDAEKLIQRAYEMGDRLESTSSADADGRASALHKLAVLYRMQRKEEKSEECFKKALRLREENLEPTHPSIAATCLAFGMLYNQLGRPTQARPLLEKAANIMKTKNMSAYPMTLAMLADAYRLEKNVPKARDLFEQAVRVIRTRNTAADAESATVYSEFGRMLLVDEKRYQAAAEAFKESLAIEEQLGDVSSSSHAYGMLLMAKSLREWGRLEEADRHCRTAMTIILKNEGARSEHYGEGLLVHSIILKKMGKLEQAQQEEAMGNQLVRNTN